MEIQMEKCKWCGINFEWDESMSKFCDICVENIEIIESKYNIDLSNLENEL